MFWFIRLNMTFDERGAILAKDFLVSYLHDETEFLFVSSVGDEMILSLL